jgi:hypothetical protein
MSGHSFPTGFSFRHPVENHIAVDISLLALLLLLLLFALIQIVIE